MLGHFPLVVALAGPALFAPFAPVSPFAPTPHGGFVGVAGTNLTLNGGKFTFAGANTFVALSSEREAEDQLKVAKAQGVNAIRLWGFWDGEDPAHPGADRYGRPVLQARPGVFPEEGWRKLDYVIARAAFYGMKLVIPLLNEWPEFGGITQYLAWAGVEVPAQGATEGAYAYDTKLKEIRAEFWTNAACKRTYFAYVDHMLERVNTFTGVAYKNDPTIMIWEIMNEPRFGPWQTTSAAAALVTRWLDDAAKHIKSIDARHLVSTGEEGFLSGNETRAYPWRGAIGEGSDFEQNAALASIDVLSIHAWPFQWSLFDEYGPGNPGGRTYADFTPEWIDAHLAVAERVKKPLYLGEFGWQILRREGSNVAERDVILSSAFSHALGTSIAGVAYWHSTPRHDVAAATYAGPITRPDVQQAIYSDNVVPHDRAFRFDVYCPEDKTTCDLITDFSAKMTVRVERPDPPYPCVGREFFCGGECVNLGSDLHNCGVCGRACGAGQSCAGGVCYVPGGAPSEDAGAPTTRPDDTAPRAYEPREPQSRAGDCGVSGAGERRAPDLFAIFAAVALLVHRVRRPRY